MGWEDRSYHRDRSGSTGNPLLRLLNGSIPLFTIFGIRVRAHAMLLIFIAADLLLGHINNTGYELRYRVVAMSMLFFVVLLHEFGHCFAARFMGGSADDIMLWPLGGLAYADTPHQPWPRFVMLAGGPLVNVLICMVTGSALFFFTPFHRLPLDPFHPLPFVFMGWDSPTLYCWWFFIISYDLLLFNLLPIYPLDGGQMLHTMLWPRFGHRRALTIATVIGIPAWILLAMIGLMEKQLMLAFLAVWGIMTCYRQRMILREEGPDDPWASETPDFSASLFQTEKPKRRRVNKRAIRRARKIAQAEAMERTRVDAILAKVSAQGMQSLTWSERRALRKATEHQRQRDLDLKL